uniref:Uncharacterized protein n=1 Tax=Strongyloides papillosus TaxID=174720 RepID=A0A0N5BGB4_STREA
MEIQHQLHYPLYSNLLPTGQYSHYISSNQEFPNHLIQTPLSNENFFNTSSISLPNGGENTSSTLLSTETYQPLAKIDNSNNSILNVSYFQNTFLL